MNKIKWGIIGCGDVTEVKSGPAFNKVANSSLVAVMRRDESKAQDYARRHSVPKWYNDAHKLISDEDINAIYIATPPSTHEEFALAAINAGKPVYLEKPMSVNYSSALKIADTAAAKNIKLVVAHYRREQPRWKKVKQLIGERVIGDPLLVRLELAKRPLAGEDLMDPKIAWRVNPSMSGGGLFHDLSPHQIDLMYYFFGPVRKANGIAIKQGRQYEADDLVAGTILFENGTAFSGTWCFNAASETDHCEIQGTDGKISFSVFSTDSFVLLAQGKPATFTFDSLVHVQQPMIDAATKYFLGEGPNPCSGYEGAEVMRLIGRFVN